MINTKSKYVYDKANTFNGQTLPEEIGNAVSHGIGTLLAAAGTGVLLASTCLSGKISATVGCSFYGACLILLYLFSTLYHSFVNYKTKKVFRVFDHCSIFLLIWGTYAPICISLIGGATGYFIFIAQSILAILGITLNIIDLKKYKKISLILYILMGWTVVLKLNTVIAAAGKSGMLLLLSGGISYTLGVLFYIKKEKPFFHFIWHLFVLTGSILHYFFVLNYCI